MSQPRLTPALTELLHTICRLVFADLADLASLTDTPRSTVVDRLKRLGRLGLVSSVSHSVGREHPKRRSERRRRRDLRHQRDRQRFFPTIKGIEAAAADLDKTPTEYWRELPVHPQVFRELVTRMDALAVIYSLAARVLSLTEYGSARVDHFTSGPYDAMLRMDGGPAIGIVRIGRRQTAQGFRVRWNDIVRAQDRWPAVVLVVAATSTGWRHAYEITAGRSGPPVFCVREEQVWETRRRVWGAPSDEELTVISLRDIVRRLPSRQERSPAAPPRRGESRIDLYPEALPATSPAVRLTPALKGLLDVIGDWHLLSRTVLPGLASVSTQRVSQMLPLLIDQGLVVAFDLDDGPYYALSDRGLRYVASRDRVSLPLGVWSVELEGLMGALGGKMRDLYGDLDHTLTVLRLMSDLAKEAGRVEGYRLSELNPPERALMRPNHQPDRAGIVPDAGGILRYAAHKGPRWISFVLEYERGRITETRITSKVELYQAFFASGHKWGPGGPPLALFVFDTREEELRFFEVAKALDSDIHRDVGVPFALSNLEQIKATGFLGRTWLMLAEGHEDNRLYLDQFIADMRG